MNVPFLYWLHEEPFDYYRYTRYALEYLTREAGLEVIELETLGGLSEVLADMVSKVAAKLPLVGPPIALAVQGMVSAFGCTSLGNSIARKTGDRFPLGYALVARKVP
jgi:hypothetical protein